MTEEQTVADIELAECLELNQLLKEQLDREHVKVQELLAGIDRLEQAQRDEHDRIKEMQERSEAIMRALQEATDEYLALRELLRL
jgi:hypothetical protein